MTLRLRPKHNQFKSFLDLNLDNFILVYAQKQQQRQRKKEKLTTLFPSTPKKKKKKFRTRPTHR